MQKKIRRQVKAIVMKRWLNFVPKFCQHFGVTLSALEVVDGKKPPSVSAIKKEMELYVATQSQLQKKLGLSATLLQRGIQYIKVRKLQNPEGIIWFDLQFCIKNRERFIDMYLLNTTCMAEFLGVTRETIRRRLKKAEIQPYSCAAYRSYQYLWRDVCCLFPEPHPTPEEVLNYHQTHQQELLEAQRRKEEEARQREQERLRELKDRLMAMFPIRIRETQWPAVTLHVGPTNSGKTHHALEALKAASSGIYLAPLRLLAWEVYETLNQQEICCDLVTGEEVITTPDAPYCAATVEMYDAQWAEVIVLDEAQMAADPERGGAWTRVLTQARSQTIHICCAPEAEELLKRVLDKIGYKQIHTHYYQRLCPLRLSDQVISVEKPRHGTIYVVFSRNSALALKSYFEEDIHIPTSIIYGALPPDVRKAQAQRFLQGETKLCVATDAIGMGMNLPAQYVSFTTLKKFDGKQLRTLTPLEVRQIAGRAGRYGLHEEGEISVCNSDDFAMLRQLFEMQGKFPSKVRISPTLLELEMIDGSLHQRLSLWKQMEAIPEDYLQLLKPASLEDQLKLASQLPQALQQQMGLERSFTVVQAPVHETALDYWHQCVHAIVEQHPLPLPQMIQPINPPKTRQLDELERCVKEAELFLWLGHRHLFCALVYPEEMQQIRLQKQQCSQGIDRILHKARLKKSNRCRQCNKKLPPLYQYGLCGDCYEWSYMT
jgi:ATP-dependent RNA helicase SUPV3L1/SUV3